MELRAERLGKSYHGIPVLKDVSFTAGVGVTCVMAPSGTGKTTLLRILLGLEQPDTGVVRRPENCRWGVVFQENRLLEQLDALGNLRFVLGQAFRETEALPLLNALGLGDVGEKQVRDYSGGMKRRLALARALLVPSDILVLDEPFAGLDEENRANALDCIRPQTKKKPVLLVSHDEADAHDLNAVIFRL